MEADELKTFTDRHEIVALFEKFCELDQIGLLPFLTLLGPSGSGKTRLIRLLARRCNAALPYAHLDCSQEDAPKTLLLALINLCDQLKQSSKKSREDLNFPRFYLGALLVFADLPDGNPLELVLCGRTTSGV